MSRSSFAARNLTLTEELEKLEQSITLTLQEIDHNFSKAHRIVTSSILPIIEQYGQHSQQVWEGSKFWKQFFEASANVSLSGYEEAAVEDDLTYTGTAETQDSTFETPPPQTAQDDTITDHDESQLVDSDDEGSSMLDSPSNATGVHSTPQILGSTSRSRTRSPPPPKSSTQRIPHRSRQASDEPSTPRPQMGNNNLDSSPFNPPSAYQPPTAQRQNPDPLLHRVLDKSYRVQATPLTTRKETRYVKKDQATPISAAQRSMALDSSPLDSSPAVPPPQLRSDLFSPAPQSAARTRANAGPRTPGISVQQTPGTQYTSTGQDLFTSTRTQQSAQTSRTPALWDSDSEGSDDFGGMSPPKTMQFAVPQSRLMQTPAREASKKIVEDLLLTAGAEATDEIEGIGEERPEQPSPSVVKRVWEDDDTF